MKARVGTIMRLASVLFLMIPRMVAGEETNQNDASKFKVFRHRSLNIDVKFVDKTKGDFGIDYELTLERDLSDTAKEHVLFANIKSEGFVMVSGSENKLNSIVNEANLQVHPLWEITKR